MKRFLVSLIGIVMSLPVLAAGGGDTVIRQAEWSFSGPFGHFDKASMQRGFQVYREVCAGCHSLKYIAFRNLADLGYSEAEIKAIAAEYDVEDGPNDEGEMFTRPGIPADRMPSPYANDNAARAANNGAYPPDLSLIFKARPNGADYRRWLAASPRGSCFPTVGGGSNGSPPAAASSLSVTTRYPFFARWGRTPASVRAVRRPRFPPGG